MTPCLTCGRRGPWRSTRRAGARCPTCAAAHEAARNRRRLHYRGTYRARSKAAKAATGHRCERCGGSPVETHHTRPGDPTSPLLVLCTRCHRAVHGAR